MSGLFLPTRADHEHSSRLAALPGFFGKSLVIEPSPGQLSSDAGLLPIRQFDEGHFFAAAAEAMRRWRASGS
jgi:hypothetical protein